MCHNVSSLSAIIQLDATQLSQFRALTSRTIHSSGQSSSMSQAFDFQLLNPAATVTVSAAPPLASATPAAMPRDKDAMNSLTQRASAIEKEVRVVRVVILSLHEMSLILTTV